jgi:hypothetical protein
MKTDTANAITISTIVRIIIEGNSGTVGVGLGEFVVEEVSGMVIVCVLLQSLDSAGLKVISVYPSGDVKLIGPQV